MKTRDYIWLGSKSIRNSRSAKMTIIGITVSMLLLTTVAWLGFAFYFDAQNKLNEHAYNNIFTLDYSGDGLTAPTVDNNNSLANSIFYYDVKTARELLDSNAQNITEKCESFMVTLQPGDSLLSVDDATYNSQGINALKFIDITSNKTYLSNIDNAVKAINGKGVLSAGKGFSSSDARNEIIVSERWLSQFGLSASIIDKQIDLSVNVGATKFAKNNFSFFSAALDNDSDPNNLHRNANHDNYIAEEFLGGVVNIFHSYKVVGVISDEYFTDDLNTKYDADIWLPTSALHNASGATYLPTISEQTLYDNNTPYSAHVLTYNDSDIVSLSQKATLTDGVVFPFFIAGGYDSPWARKAQQNISSTSRNSYSSTPIYSTQLELASFNKVKSFYGNYQSFFGEMIFFRNSDNLNSLPVNPSTFAAIEMSAQYDSILIVMLILGIIVMLVTLFNYYNILSYHSKTRLKYYGIMRAMGAKKSEYTALRITEMALTLCLSLAFATIISLCICGGLVALANYPKVNAMLYQLNLSLAYFPLAVTVTFGFFAIVSALILYLTRVKQSKTSVVAALRANRH